MHHARQLEKVRHFVQDAFRAHDAEARGDCLETILISDGYYTGRSFICERLRAVWFIEENVIKFYGPEGDFLFASSADDAAPQRQERAA